MTPPMTSTCEAWRLLAMAIVSVSLTAGASCPALAQSPIEALPMADTGSDARLAPPAALSRDGRNVAFESDAALLAADTNHARDIYLLDRETRALRLVSRPATGLGSTRGSDRPSRHPSISEDGRVVVFESQSRAIDESGREAEGWHVYAYERGTDVVRLVTAVGATPAEGAHGGARLSADGLVIVFHSTTREQAWGACGDGSFQIYAHDLATGSTQAVTRGCGTTSVSATFPSVSGDGALVAYVRRDAASGTPTAIWLAERASETHRRLVDAADGGTPDGPAYSPTLSANGRWVAFVSRATNLAPRRLQTAEPQIYLRHVDGGPTLLVSAAPDGRPGNGASGSPAIDGDGLVVVFHSLASNLRQPTDRPDINLVSDVFRWSLGSGTVSPVSNHAGGAPWLDASDAPATSGDGHVVAFRSRHPVDDLDDRETFDLYLVVRR